jgi:hypothetical protein
MTGSFRTKKRSDAWAESADLPAVTSHLATGDARALSIEFGLPWESVRPFSALRALDTVLLRSCSPDLPAVVGECLVCFGHPVRVFLLLDG